MKKFKVKYYELVVTDGKEYDILTEDIVVAEHFKVYDGGILFGNTTVDIHNGVGLAYYPRVLSVKEIKSEEEI